MSYVPVPKDIPLPLPAPEPVLVLVLVFFFLMHIVFVNFMVGGSLLSLWYQVRGLKDKAYEKLAYELTSSITVNKSMAVVLGVGPLLAINTLYTVYFYSANALTGRYWISIIPLVAAAFLLTYLHKYTWHKLEKFRFLSISISIIANLIFLFVPLIFFANINLMLFPAKWVTVKSFFDALFVGNVFPRYLHFLLGSIALTGLYIVWRFRHSSAVDFDALGLGHEAVVKLGYGWALWPTLAQFLIGPAVVFTLPKVEGSLTPMLIAIGSGAAVAVLMTVLIQRQIKRTGRPSAGAFYIIAALMAVVLLCMGSGRHLYREAALSLHKPQVAARTKAYMDRVRQAAERTAPPAPPEAPETSED